MKFGLVGPVYPYRGGIAHYTTMLYRALRERGHQVLLVSFRRQYPQWLFPGQSDKDPSKRPLKVTETQYWLDSLNPITWLTAYRRLQQYEPDAIILQWWTSFWAPAWAVLGGLNRLLQAKPLIYICHNVLPHETHWWDPYVARTVLRRGTWFVVQSAAERERLRALVPKAAIDVVPHPVYNMLADHKVSQEEARRQLGLPADVTILLFFGMVRAYKGLEDILKALPEIRTRVGEVLLVVAGEFWEDRQPYEDVIDRLGIGDVVILEDRYIPNEEVPLYFSAADALVAAYRHKTGSGAVQMARGFGLPVVEVSPGELSDEGLADQDSLIGSKLGDGVARLIETGGRPAGSDAEAASMAGWETLADSVEAAVRSLEGADSPS